ncbi:SLC13 family permease [Alkalimonas collagenimarina]|uniref:SLC13 family permease n=1 Tax=Alkalimonas collagenimarina TaxID=400390 RepID=A0ABT9GYC1_9GAMM|nr:SLC13 family permease [Alkalimonas collagenimarina]MDP4536056.1 SLC13 family permease [Alkalimonas collagenimarina]
MELSQLLIFLILAITVVLFIWGRWRHDMIALASLLACVLVGLVPTEHAFAGFGHPAVITVACVLVLSQALQATGAVDVLAMRVLPKHAGPTFTIAALTALAAILSAFMNNVGALALLMPIAIQVSARTKLAPGQVLMPVAFGSILGGMTTLIGTPPNLIVSGFRAEVADSGFGMFDFSPVGAAVALIGVIFVALIGWRLVPVRSRSDASSFETSKYLTEIRITEQSKLVDTPLKDLEKKLEEMEAQVVGIVRNNYRAPTPPGYYRLANQDILVIEAEPESLGAILTSLGLSLEESEANQKVDAKEKEDTKEKQVAKSSTDNTVEKTKKEENGDIHLLELAVLPNSELIRRTAAQLSLRRRFNINLLALSRHGQRSIKRVRRTAIQAGDVLLLQGQEDALNSFASEFGCVPLAERQIRVPEKKNTILASIIMLGAISGAAFGLLPAAISFAAGILAIMVFKVMPLRKVYTAIDWPVIVLLACLIPVAGALATTGAADLMAQSLLDYIAGDHAILALAIVLILTMTLSDFMNNAATAAMMCPIAISIAEQLSVRSDPFLMAVAIGASCAFLTPIGHQNNTLILGPGGFRFGDYWRLGLPMELVVIVTAIPALLFFWPL